MSRVCLLTLATLLACARAYADEPEVDAFVGGMVTLRHLNVQDELWMHTDTSLPKIWWEFRDMIDGSTGRYRLLSDGALQIVPLYRNDSGVYTFTALNKFGRITQKIHLVVNDTKKMPAGIAGEENAVVTGELGSPLEVRCLVYGKPPPSVFWYTGFDEEAMFIDNDSNYETRGNVLTIKSLNQDSLGKYTCRALNGVGPDAYWKFVVQTNMPQEPLVPENDLPQPGTQPPTTVETTTTGLLSNDEPEVYAFVGGMATLRHLNVQNELWMHTETSLPKIWWDFRDIKIDGSTGRYRLLSDGALQIVPLYRNDSGVYTFTALNKFGRITQKIHLVVNDTKKMPAGIAGEENAVVTGELGSPLEVRCLVYGKPPPSVFWYTGFDEEAMFIDNDSNYETRGNVLTIKSLNQDSLGKYTCRALNGVGPDAYWKFVVQTNMPQEPLGPENDLPQPGTQPPTTVETTTTGLLSNETSTTGAMTETTTETTESIETSEGSTTNEGTTDVTGSITLDPCSSFEFGCCADNETEASGPDGQGCPCNATEFGCCPDGVSPASGLENEGCPGPCSTSPHGCCQDDKTPAHGTEFEGCCLLQAFRCCPDNRKPAEGLHLEGCGCQYAFHGCCPDNVTIAQGPDNQGCGCQYTENGCCPDRHTAASGPRNEGCACNTYQFGCCPDGVTTAKGPEQQGCHCRDSKFGCCRDGETPATGPEGAGCDCSSSRHRCCPDGRTEATGPKFFGCTDAPENKQASCSMSSDPGPCHNFTAMWFYDLAYGGCSRFWYGGCDGNGNRFFTKEDCEDVCVQPSPKDACKLPSVKGACDGDYQRWYYNSTREQCIPFIYGGCLGNANNFDTRELCQKQCEPSSVTDQCKLPIDQGSCVGNYISWGFNFEAHRCKQFIWGGCEGNSNRFSSETACQMHCAGTQPPQCTQPQEAGHCTEKEALWSFSQSENRCLPFYYSGCGGNDNRFSSREACEQTCPSAYVADKCTLPAETGQCSNYRERWFYDTTFNRCRQFYYGGCGGNENNFGTEAECDNSCSEIKTTTTTTTSTTTASLVEPQPEPRPHETNQRPAAPDRSEFCFNAIDAGPCNNTETRYAYVSELGRCVTFQYGGCGGNQNNFPDLDYCSYYCQPMQVVKAGACPMDETTTNEVTCRHECGDDAECRGVGKCCRRGCSDLCLVPLEQTSPHPLVTTTVAPNVPAAPLALPQPEPEVEGSAGGSATLRCLFHGNPPPKITWRFGELTIDSNAGRYRLMSDGALKIVSLHRNDTGVYICVADNGVGVATQEIHLAVNDVPAAAVALPQSEPELVASEGGLATLRCLFHGNPPPKITWRFGELTIDGNAGRYRLMSDGTLNIVSLYRNDTGVYICVADNGLGVATQEIHLAVSDPVKMLVRIAGDENAVVTGELGSPLEVRCLAYGYPPPFVSWYRGYNEAMVPYNNTVYLARGNILLIRRLAIKTLGQYTCQAYNGEGKAASWVVFVRAYQPEGLFIENELLVPRNPLPSRPRTKPPTTAETTTTTTTSTTKAPRPLFTVPVYTHVSTPFSTLNSGADLYLTCDVDGFPEPDVHWTKDGATIQVDGRITITGSSIVSRLTVARVSFADSGLYTCHASNQYSSHSETAQINVQQLVVPTKCTDNPFFTDCNMIVRSKFCRQFYYSKFCCKSCIEAGQLDPQEAALQADQHYTKK